MRGVVNVSAGWLRRSAWRKSVDDTPGLGALDGLQVLDLDRRDDVAWLLLAREGVTSAALARPALVDATGAVHQPETIIRVVEAGWVFEQYSFPLTNLSSDLQIHVSAGFGCPGMTVPLPIANTRRAARRHAA